MENIETGAAPAATEGNAAPVVSTPEVTNNEPASMESTMAQVFDRLNPQTRVNRAETGEFESKSPVEQTEQAEGQTQTETPVEPATPAIEAPQSLPAALRDKFASAAPELREWLAKREAESHKRITELGETAKTGETFRQVTSQYSQEFQKYGVNPIEGVVRMLNVQRDLDRDPAGTIAKIAQVYQVDLSGFAGPANGEPAPQADYIRSLEQRVAAAERKAEEASTRVLSREQQEHNTRLQSLAKLEDEFSKGKDYWTDIYEDVVDQVKSIMSREPDLAPEKVLQKAHDRALKLRDDISSKLNESKRKEDEAKAEAEKKRKADEAKKHASLNVKSSNTTSPAKRTWEETMRAEADRLYG